MAATTNDPEATASQPRSPRSNSTAEEPLRCHLVECARVIRVDNNDSYLTCGMCRRTYHLKCTSMSAAGFIDYTKMSELKWFCNPCDKQSDRVFMGLFDLKQSHEALAKSHQDLSKRVEVIEKEDLTNRLETLEKANIETRLDELESKSAGAAPVGLPTEGASANGGGTATVASSTKNSVSAAVAEMQDIEHRKCNLVIYGIKESESSNTKDRVTHDREEVAKVFRAVKVPDTVNASVRAVIRLGEKQDGKNRGLKVILSSPQEKAAVLKGASTLKDTAAFKYVFIKPDLTKLQQVEQKKLWNKVIDKRQKVGKDKAVFIRGNKVRVVTRSTPRPGDPEATDATGATSQAPGNAPGGTEVPLEHNSE